jgi:antibiotic biosynthesis monooxygenase (ABM) superfamily enzyme
MTTYRTVLLRFDGDPIYTGWPGVLKRGLSLEQAQAICRDPETSSSTASAKHRYGDKWFVGYEEDKPKTRNRYKKASMHAALEATYGEN